MSQYVNEVMADIAFQKRLAKLAEQKKAGLDVQAFCTNKGARPVEHPTMTGGAHHVAY